MRLLDHKGPLGMGAMMGLMLPWMMHSDGRAGLAFVAAHLAIIAVIGAIVLLWPQMRRRLAPVLHRPRLHHMIPMGVGLAIGLAATCVYCLTIGGQHWT